ncbi:uncharacterized protein BX663DRAFT_502378 [Cokeromyces recurvatus]|uniref:uncharacterized protein n=1 Tax=Cokeromyces recurvatus TaxID=90255 RepID=UPI00221FE2A1|nr:uncharacterized protein BX663DRAFT_502378 [Cokeromyces recurvatus]KAI7905294.1 hypothetical protein BX663DRAFT_502378 [Cokeromyces recurvatus]
MSIESIDQLIHAIANISHVERPYLENLLAIKKLEIMKEPIDKEHQDALSKVTMWETQINNLNSWTLQWLITFCTCGLKTEKQQAEKGLKKAKELVSETEKQVQAEKDKIHTVELQNEKYSIDYRNLEKYREEMTVLLDNALKDHNPTVDTIKDNIEDCKKRSCEKFNNIEKLEKVKELLKTADTAILEAILELRSSVVKESLMGEGKVYFPELAYNCLKQAREEYPDLPGFQSPTEYKNEADNTGAYYSPMQKYLWDVRHKLAELIIWCDNEALSLLEDETQIQIELGSKIDEYNTERRKILKENI